MVRRPVVSPRAAVSREAQAPAGACRVLPVQADSRAEAVLVRLALQGFLERPPAQLQAPARQLAVPLQEAAPWVTVEFRCR